MKPIDKYSITRSPLIEFGKGVSANIPALASRFGGTALVIHGGSVAGFIDKLAVDLQRKGIKVHRQKVQGEPSPETVDLVAVIEGAKDVSVVIAVGGGSAIDAGKALSAMIGKGFPVERCLEGVGDPSIHPGTKVPFIAVPTTAGTGSEATKNAVLSRVGKGGFKFSLRHDNFVPDIAVVDPVLTLTCPPDLTAACGMDALTQLLESYVSPKASPFTDALAESGMRSVASSLVSAATDGGADISTRSQMSYAALASGITLANAGLGIVHGIAAKLGGMHPIPHGVICGTLLATATEMTIRKIEQSRGWADGALGKYARAGEILSGIKAESVVHGCSLLLDALYNMEAQLRIPKLGDYRLSPDDAIAVSREDVNKSNPVALDPGAIESLILKRL